MPVTVLLLVIALVGVAALFALAVKLRPRHLVASGSLTKWFTFNLEMDDPEQREPPKAGRRG